MILRRNRSERRRGATIVEMAFVLSICVLMLFGILEYGRYLFFMHVATNATAAGARYAVVHTGDGTTLANVQAQVNNIMVGQQGYVSGYTVNVFAAQTGVSPPTVVAGSNWNDAQFGSGICVQITGTYSFAAASLLGISTIPISVSAVMSSEAN
jgi:Flp pilus assembly protein TadG